ncbi:uncharacterized protein DNG_01827 [Cephalotrichum gorgonifer]|uniref:P450 domain-containing protein n=1 Tax=Cephalotrichum gorgonifer TaxID=2041049 RepID=A0AAE8SS11_9PEZI|nr:uncharacterized protein DNG_01827 [Cephalotrichum gorgonifer]
MNLLRLADPTTWPTSIWVLLLTAVGYLAYSLLDRPAFPRKAPPVFEANPVVGARRFFSRRNVFLEDITSKSKSGQASFYYGKFQVVALSGEHGRRAFFESRDLDFNAGYSTLFNAAPKVSNDERERFGEIIKKALVKFMRTETLVSLTPSLVSDCRAAVDHFASLPTRTMNPFDDFYRLVYKLTMRTVGCKEIASDPELLGKTLRIFEGIDGANAATKLLFPWLPTPSHLRRMYAGTKMFLIFKRIIDERKRKGVREDDALQFLIDQEWSLTEIVSVIIAALFAGQVNSGMNAAWLICFLAESPTWLATMREEVDGVVARHRAGPGQAPADVLASLSFEDWEREFPVIDAGLKETIRFTITGCGFRQNTSGKEVEIGRTGEVIPNDAFAVYLFDDVHMNPQVYKDPFKWDPSRYAPETAEDKKTSHGYIGWGSGRHPCLGMRFAKLEMAMMVAHFVASFDFSLVDDSGKPARISPASIDRTKHQAPGPSHPLFIRYEPR